MRADEYDELKKEIVEKFEDESFEYNCSDRLQVALHGILDDWVSCLGYSEVMTYLSDFDDGDIETLDKGLYEGVLEKRGLSMFHRVLLYCLVEQELYNEDDFNELQFVEEVAGIKLE